MAQGTPGSGSGSGEARSPSPRTRRSKQERQAYQAPEGIRDELAARLTHSARDCVECGKCLKDCGFLQDYGTPQEIAFRYDPGEQEFQRLAFECSLCGLCSEVCPDRLDIDPWGLFQEMRREAVDRGQGCFSQHDRMVGYENKGNSSWLSWYGLPEGCKTVFFPGCTLPGSQPDNVEKLFDLLREKIPDLGIVLDCCNKPSHDLGRQDFFQAQFGELRDYLLAQGVETVLVGCPSCYQAIDMYGEDLSVETVYEHLDQIDLPAAGAVRGTVAIHDPCSTRDREEVHAAVRGLVYRRDLDIEEFRLHGREAICCGEGASVGFLEPERAGAWAESRAEEAGDRRVVTYCSGCVHFVGAKTPTNHVLDLVFQPEKAMAGEVRVAKAPFTYLNRIWLKWRFWRKLGGLPGVRTRVRDFWAPQDDRARPQRWPRVLAAVLLLLGGVSWLL